MSAGPGARPGFYGKLPSRGDFVSRRLSAGFVSHWDTWLQGALAASRTALGSAWLDVYLTSPIWRFALSPDICGEESHVGVMMPSVDKVGRYFPLVVAVPLGERTRFAITELDDWYADVEAVLLETLADTPLDPEELDDRLSRLTPPQAAAAVPDASVSGTAGLRHWTVPAGGSVADALSLLCPEALDRWLGPHGLWWTQGSEAVEPCVLAAPELPATDAFVAMLDGRWGEHGWASGMLHHAARPSPVAPAFAFRSAAFSDAGKVRKVNEDACACRDDPGVWLVADGLGGHQAGDTASRMVTSVIDRAGDASGLVNRIEALGSALGIVNDCLQVLADRNPAVTLAGSTVVALLADGASAACVWAGDSRIYRLRDGELRQLSRDHSEAAEGSNDDHTITRAVGGIGELQLEVDNVDLRAGDRYLLCTDGVHGEIAAAEIVAALSLTDPQQACEQLRDVVLAGEARDNLTAVVVEVTAAPSTAGGLSY